MRILVTGANGFLGRHLVRALLHGNHDVTSLDLPTEQASNQTCLVSCDLTDAVSTRSALRGLEFDAVIHLAYAPRGSSEMPTRKVGAEGTRNLLEFLEPGFGRFILAGSSAVYGSVPADDLPVAESRPPAPVGFYGACHLERELVVKEMLSGAGAEICIFRMFNLIGPGQEPVMLVPQVARKLALAESGEREDPLTMGSLESRRDYVDVRDAARAYLHAVSRSLGGLCKINLCSGLSISGRDVVRALCGLFGERVPVHEAEVTVEPSPNDVMDLTGDRSAALELLGWQPSIGLGRSLEDVAEEWRRRVRENRA